jgi:hypothetical protein
MAALDFGPFRTGDRDDRIWAGDGEIAVLLAHDDTVYMYLKFSEAGLNPDLRGRVERIDSLLCRPVV